MRENEQSSFNTNWMLIDIVTW